MDLSKQWDAMEQLFSMFWELLMTWSKFRVTKNCFTCFNRGSVVCEGVDEFSLMSRFWFIFNEIKFNGFLCGNQYDNYDMSINEPHE